MLPSIILALPLLVLSSVAAVPPVRRDPIHVPFLRRSVRHDGDLSRYAAAADHTRKKFGYSISSPSRRASSADVGLTNQGQDTSYFTQVSVGTPPQTFGLVLDTGSSDLWFATTGCVGCQGTQLLSPTSNTLKLTTTNIDMSYGSGDASGTVASDTVSMGPYTVNPQTFVAVNKVSQGLIDGQLSGIMGLAFQGIAVDQAVPFWQALINQNQLTSPQFCFAFTRFLNDASATNEEPGGVMTLGGTNTTLFQGSIDFQTFTDPVKGGSFWWQTISGVTVNGNTISLKSSGSAAIDTGTTLIGGPTEDVNAFWAAVPGATSAGSSNPGMFVFPCSTKLSVTFSFGGPSWPINPTDVNLGAIDTAGKMCLGAIFDLGTGSNIQPGPQSANPEWVVGDTFLKNVYSCYRSNPPAVGFAQLSASAGSSDHSGFSFVLLHWLLLA
ncbi:aspartic peptidase domain-containing protein [Russula dissimulans]|nr:aspartic peptidase domain-containing protein [Russula dissimulans]